MNLQVGEQVISVDLVGELTPQEYIQQQLASQHPTWRREDSDHEDPFYVVDLGRVIYLYDRWMEKFPQIKPFYAVKCNEDPALIKTLAALGAGFDCASKNEVKLITELGVAPEHIIYSNPCKQISHIKYAASKGVSLMVFDGEEEVHKIKEHFPQANLVIRVEADDQLGTSPLVHKFGCSVEEGKKLLLLCRQLELKVIGVSFHVGTMSENPSAYKEALAACSMLFKYGAEVGYDFTLLDVGGGFPGKRGTTDLEVFDKMVDALKQALSLHFNPSLYPHLRIIAEPGTYFSKSTHALAVNIIGKRLHKDPQSGEVNSFMYHINEGIFGSFIYCALSCDFICIPQPLRSTHPNSKVHSSIVWGQTLDPKDKICEIDLPQLNIGDWLYFDNMGAYTVELASTFNGFEIPAKLYYVTESYRTRFKHLLQ